MGKFAGWLDGWMAGNCSGLAGVELLTLPHGLSVIRFLLLVGLLVPSSLAAKWQPVPSSRHHTINSKILGEKRDISIVIPPTSNPPSTKYTVVVVLDGDGLLPLASAYRLWTSDDVRLLFVGVRSLSTEDRFRNFTPPPDSATRQRYPVAGGAPRFLRFLSEEVLPYVKKEYQTTGTNILIGHSLSGLFAVEALLDPSMPFSRVVAISPTLGWQNQELVRRLAAAMPSIKGRVLFASTADEGSMYPIAPTVRVDSLLKAAGISSTYKHYTGYDHWTTVPPALYDGLRLTAR